MGARKLDNGFSDSFASYDKSYFECEQASG